MSERTDAERLRCLAEYCEGVGPVSIVVTNIYNTTDDEPPCFVIREADSFVMLGSGETIAEALDAFCDHFDREFPTDPSPSTGRRRCRSARGRAACTSTGTLPDD